MVMTLIPAMETRSRSIDSTTEIALPCSPDGSTGRVSQTASLRCAASRLATAAARRSSAPKLFSAAPSMSRSIVVR
jgi:hypothetical protein